MSTATAAKGIEGAEGTELGLHRKIDWTGAFWVASGVPALVLFSIGGIAATVGKASWLVWTISIIFGFIQSFTYAEIAGLFPGKSGGASVYGAVAWVRYAKFIAPTSVWCNWFAWSPVLAIGSGLGAGYILSLFFAPDAAINTWQITLLDLGAVKEGLTLRINATFFIGLVLMLACFLIQHGGILRSARATMLMGVAALLPLMLIGIVPLLTGDLPRENFVPLVPLGHDAAGAPLTELGTRRGGSSSSEACSSPPGRLTGSRRPSATRESSRIRNAIRSRPSSTPASCALRCSSLCRCRSRALLD